MGRYRCRTCDRVIPVLLTERQKEVYDRLVYLILNQRRIPTYRELAKDLGVHLRTIQDHIVELINRGWIVKRESTKGRVLIPIDVKISRRKFKTKVLGRVEYRNYGQ